MLFSSVGQLRPPWPSLTLVVAESRALSSTVKLHKMSREIERLENLTTAVPGHMLRDIDLGHGVSSRQKELQRSMQTLIPRSAFQNSGIQ